MTTEMLMKSASLNWALRHVRREGDTDLFPCPFEFEVIRKNWTTVQSELLKIEVNKYAWKGPRRLLVPKSELSFRPVCQLDPLDSLLFAALVREIGKKLESHRSPPSDDRVFSYRFNPSRDGRLYASTTGWEDFWKVSASRCDESKYVLITDFSDYYNQIYHHTIENQLDECHVTKEYWYALRNLLSNVSEGVSRGIPIGPHPAHLLAEMAMIPVDQYIINLGVNFCRYVDDIHIFCDSKDQGHAVLYHLVDHLDRTQKIQINKQKTRIEQSHIFKIVCQNNVDDHPINPVEEEMLKTVRSYTKGPYDRVRATSLSASDLSKMSQANIESVLREYIDAGEVDYVRLRWFIRRLTQLGAPGGVPFIIRRFNEFLPAIAEVGKYFEASAPNFTGEWADIGEDLIAAYNTGIVQANEYLQVVILSLFSRIRNLNHIHKLTSIYAQSTPMCQRKIMLAAAAASASAWLSTLKGEYKNADPWKRRAVLYSLRALPKDEKKFWLKSVKKQVSGLDALIAEGIGE